MKGSLLSLLVGAGFIGGMAVGISLHPHPTPSLPITVGGSSPRAERNFSAHDVRPAARGLTRTVIQAKAAQGTPLAPPISSATAPDWTTSWTLEPLNPTESPCLHPTLHVATTLRIEGTHVLAESTGWGECGGIPLRIGDALQVEQRRTLLLPPAPSFPWRAGLLWAPPQQGRDATFGFSLQRDLGRVSLQLIAFPDRVAIGMGLSWGTPTQP
jgi:hypothetical protein